jgi:hypothetical protein
MKHTVFQLIGLVAALAAIVGCQKEENKEEHRSDYATTEAVPLTSGKGKNEDACLLRAIDGTIYMAWFSDRGGNADIYLISSQDAKSWTEPVAIVQGGGGNFYPSLAQTDDGTFHLTWFRIDIKRRAIRVWYVNSKDAATWSEPRAMTPDESYNWVPTIEAAGDTVWIVWSGNKTGNKDIFLVESNDRGRTWQEPAQVTNHPFHDDLPNIARKPDGSLIIVWTRHEPGKGDYLSNTSEIHYAISKDGKAWSEPVALTHNDYADTIPEVYSNLDESEFFAVWCSVKGLFDLPLADIKAEPKHILDSDVGGYSLRLLPLTKDDYLVVWVRKVAGQLHIYGCQLGKSAGPVKKVTEKES